MSQDQNSQFLGKEKISKLMLKFSIPCVLSLLVSALYNIVDQIFVGNSELSALGNAATGVVFPIFIIAQAFAWCFGDGCAAYLNICQGKRDTKNATQAIGTGIVVTLVSSALLMAFFYPFKIQLLTLFGASENSIGYAVEYFNLILAFFPIYMLSNMMNAIQALSQLSYTPILRPRLQKFLKHIYFCYLVHFLALNGEAPGSLKLGIFDSRCGQNCGQKFPALKSVSPLLMKGCFRCNICL